MTDVARGTAQPRREWLRSNRLWTSVVVGLLCAGCLLAVVGIWVEQREQAPAQDRLRTELRPAQVDTERLVRAYDDQETGLRGFLLTGEDATLAPYRSGTEDVSDLLESLAGHLQDYPTAAELLEGVRAHGEEWRRTVAEPQLAARGRGPVAQQQQLVTFVAEGQRVFDQLRDMITALSAQVGRLITVELERFDSAQDTARSLQRSALGVVLVGASLIALVLWRMGSRPLRRLVEGVDAVAAGDYSRPVPQGGPQEYASLGRAVESMRQGLVRRSEELRRAERDLAMLEEQERLASELQDVTIQRIFALGLRLSSLASAGRSVTERELTDLVAETDGIIAELRGVIFPRRDSVDHPSTSRAAPAGAAP